jgi:hypothetical protein
MSSGFQLQVSTIEMVTDFFTIKGISQANMHFAQASDPLPPLKMNVLYDSCKQVKFHDEVISSL